MLLLKYSVGGCRWGGSGRQAAVTAGEEEDGVGSHSVSLRTRDGPRSVVWQHSVRKARPPLLLLRDWHKIQFKRKHWNFSHSLPRLGMSCTNPYFVSKEPVRWFKFLTEIQEISCIFDGDYIKGDLSHKMKVNMKTRSREGSVTGSIVISQLVKVINFVFLSLWNI